MINQILKISLFSFFGLMIFFILPQSVQAHAPIYEGWVRTTTGVGIPCVWVRQGDGAGNFRYAQTGGSPCNTTTPVDINAAGFPNLTAGSPLPAGMYAFKDLSDYDFDTLDTMAATPIDTNLDGTNDHKLLEMIYTFSTAYGLGFGCVSDPQQFSAIMPAGWTGSFSTPPSYTINNIVDNVAVDTIVYTGTVPSPTATPTSLPTATPTPTPTPIPTPTPPAGPLVRPNTPIKKCDPIAKSPVCDNGFASPSRNLIAAQNSGFVNSGQPETITFSLNSNPPVTGSPFAVAFTPTPKISAIDVTTLGVPLVSGTTYTWLVGAVASDFQVSLPDPPAGAWHFTWDNIPPTVAYLSPTQPCISNTAPPAMIEVSSRDLGLNPSGISSVTIKVDTTATPAVQEIGRSDGRTDVYSIPFGSLSTGVHTVYARSIDNAGNITDFTATPLAQFSYSSGACFGPWLQTVGGDAHSNIGIQTLGGP